MIILVLKNAITFAFIAAMFQYTAASGAMRNLHYFPLIVFFGFPITFAITYIMAVYLKDVPPLYPYISDTGNFSPESCIFGQLLNLGSLLMAFVVYIRYRQVRYVCENHGVCKKIQKENRKAMYLGYIGALGVSIVGNFQETNVFIVHFLGAAMAFGIGSIFMIYTTNVSFKLYPVLGSKKSNYTKLILAIMCTSCYVICLTSAIISFLLFDGTDITKWYPQHGGYKYHVISSITEWITTFSMMSFIATFSSDFKVLSLEEPVIFSADNHVIITRPVERF